MCQFVFGRGGVTAPEYTLLNSPLYNCTLVLALTPTLIILLQALKLGKDHERLAWPQDNGRHMGLILKGGSPMDDREHIAYFIGANGSPGPPNNHPVYPPSLWSSQKVCWLFDCLLAQWQHQRGWGRSPSLLLKRVLNPRTDQIRKMFEAVVLWPWS